jgi:hypothetical protein
LQAIHLRAGSETKVVAAFSKLISHIHRPVYVALSAPCMSGNKKMLPVTVYSNKIKVVELSGTGVTPSLLNEVQERRSGAWRGAGAAFRLVSAEIKHWSFSNVPHNNANFFF